MRPLEAAMPTRRRAAILPGLSASFSPELEAAAARRLGALALLVTIVVSVIMVGSQIAGARSALDSRVRFSVGILDALLSVALYMAIRKSWLRPSSALAAGVFYEVLHGFLASVVFHALTSVQGVAVRGWTSAAVWAVVYPLVVPSRPGRVWLGTLATAAMDPLSLWVNVMAGAPRPPAGYLVQMFLPTALVCVLAPIGARIVYGLTIEVKRAREMGSYRLVEKLGQGGMGEVWRADHRMLARPAAIKLIRPAALGGVGSHAREMVRRFEREAQATAGLQSPHTIDVYDYGVAEDGTFHYVMELLRGFSLQTLVDRFGPVPPARAVSLLRQACHSLAEAHAAGLVHRDVKPANLFVCRLGLDVDFVKVLDFGLVKAQGPQDGKGDTALTAEGTFTGTPAFMPPEVALGTEPIDGRADIYALGCVAYWLITGRRVFESESAMQMVIDHVRTAPVPPSRRTEREVPGALEAIILRCLEKDPDARPATVAELSAALQALAMEDAWTPQDAQAWWRANQTADEASLPEIGIDLAGGTRSRSIDAWPGQA